MYESAMDAARRRAGLKPVAESLKDERKAAAAWRRDNVKPGKWRTDGEPSTRAFPGKAAPLSDLGKVGWVYIAGAYDREKLVFVKIGYTGKSPPKRVRAIAQGVPHRVELLAAISGTRELELSYHREFYKASVRGEWFEPSPDLLARVETINMRGDRWKLHWGKKKPR